MKASDLFTKEEIVELKEIMSFWDARITMVLDDKMEIIYQSKEARRKGY